MGTRIPELASFLQELQLSQYTDIAQKWCDDMGAAFFQEIWEERHDFVEALGLKPLEKKRFLSERGEAAFRSRLPQRRPSPAVSTPPSSSSIRFRPQAIERRCLSCQTPITSGEYCQACSKGYYTFHSVNASQVPTYPTGLRCKWCYVPIASGEYCYPCSGAELQMPAYERSYSSPVTPIAPGDVPPTADSDDEVRYEPAAVTISQASIDPDLLDRVRRMVFFLQPELGTKILERLDIREELLNFKVLKQEIGAVMTQIEAMNF